MSMNEHEQEKPVEEKEPSIAPIVWIIVGCFVAASGFTALIFWLGSFI